jgi:carboxymethylenebutenolidase
MAVTEVRIPSGDDRLVGILAVPTDAGPWPAVVMVHEVFGVDDNMRAHAQQLADLGYIAVMPDLFSRGGMRKCLNATFRALQAREGLAFDDVEATKGWVTARSDCTGAVGVIGFCMGGAFALQLASRGYDASSVNYGILPKDLDAVVADACPIVASYGKDDRSLRGAASKLEASLTRNNITHDVKEYEGASHAFLNPGPAGPPVVRTIMTRVAGFGPRPEQAADAWRRIDAFFREHLVPRSQ